MEEMNNEMMIKLAMVILKSNMLQTNYSFSSPPGNAIFIFELRSNY